MTRDVARDSDASLDAQLEPHRAWLEGRAALETLEREQIIHARDTFEQVLRLVPEHALAQIGLANACVMQFETTRTDEYPDRAVLERAARHAREACRLDSRSGESWATLGFVLDRCGQPVDAAAALRRAVTLEPDNWRHHFRLSYVSWGEERLRAARRTLALLPGFPLAHWMVATVHVARGVLDQAAIELAAGIAVQNGQGERGRFSAVALHWLLGLVHLARGEDERAEEEFHAELACESSGHLYARECCANTWYALGALRLRQHRPSEARAAFERTLERVAVHPLAQIALARLGETPGTENPGEDDRLELSPPPLSQAPSVDRAIWLAAAMVSRRDHASAVAVVDRALAEAPPGNAAWTLPVEPLLHVSAQPDLWAPVLARLRARSA